MSLQNRHAHFWTWPVLVLLLTVRCGHGATTGQATLTANTRAPVAMPEQGGEAISREQVIAVVKENLAGLRACYHRALGKYRSLHAIKLNLNIEFKVHPTGGARDVFLRGSTVPDMTACMKAEIRRWRFPTFSGQPVGVAYPLTLSPGPQPESSPAGVASGASREGTLSQAQVISVVKKNLPGMRACYQQVLKKHQGLSTSRIKLTIEFQVFAAGDTRAVQIVNSPVPEMATCMKEKIQRWRFPAFTGQPVGVAYPLVLSPQ